MDAIQQSVTQLQQLFTQRMDAYQNELHAAGSSVSITSLAADFTAFRTFIMTALHSLQDQLSLVVQQQDAMEMRCRRKMLLLHGLPEAKNEDTPSIVFEAVSSQMKVTEFSTAHITRCHRMGRKSSADRPRPILFKVCDTDMKNKIWHAKTALKGSGVTLSEFLTKSRHDTFMAARQRFGLHKCWTKGGFVYVLDSDGQRHRVSTLQELEKIPIPVPSKAPSVASKETIVAPKTRRVAAANKK